MNDYNRLSKDMTAEMNPLPQLSILLDLDVGSMDLDVPEVNAAGKVSARDD